MRPPKVVKRLGLRKSMISSSSCFTLVHRCVKVTLVGAGWWGEGLAAAEAELGLAAAGPSYCHMKRSSPISGGMGIQEMSTDICRGSCGLGFGRNLNVLPIAALKTSCKYTPGAKVIESGVLGILDIHALDILSPLTSLIWPVHSRTWMKSL